jgi:predicted enzyme related to lactoylglutathione lyase
MAHGTPTLATGKICYLEIPAADVERSSRFYRDAFGWELRTRDDGTIAFDDAVKEVSGSWVTDRPPSAEPGIMVTSWSPTSRQRSRPSAPPAARY